MNGGDRSLCGGDGGGTRHPHRLWMRQHNSPGNIFSTHVHFWCFARGGILQFIQSSVWSSVHVHRARGVERLRDAWVCVARTVLAVCSGVFGDVCDVHGSHRALRTVRALHIQCIKTDVMRAVNAAWIACSCELRVTHLMYARVASIHNTY